MLPLSREFAVTDLVAVTWGSRTVATRVGNEFPGPLGPRKLKTESKTSQHQRLSGIVSCDSAAIRIRIRIV